jgi:hypothetical protein
MLQQYLIFHPDSPPFSSDWFSEENYVEGMHVVDLINRTWYDGKEWIEIELDHL